MFEILPTELRLYLFSFLDEISLLKLASSCKALHNVIFEDLLRENPYLTQGKNIVEMYKTARAKLRYEDVAKRKVLDEWLKEEATKLLDLKKEITENISKLDAYIGLNYKDLISFKTTLENYSENYSCTKTLRINRKHLTVTLILSMLFFFYNLLTIKNMHETDLEKYAEFEALENSPAYYAIDGDRHVEHGCTINANVTGHNVTQSDLDDCWDHYHAYIKANDILAAFVVPDIFLGLIMILALFVSMLCWAAYKKTPYLKLPINLLANIHSLSWQDIKEKYVDDLKKLRIRTIGDIVNFINDYTKEEVEKNALIMDGRKLSEEVNALISSIDESNSSNETDVSKKYALYFSKNKQKVSIYDNAAGFFRKCRQELEADSQVIMPMHEEVLKVNEKAPLLGSIN